MEHFFPVLCTHILKETDIGDTGIVDQNVCSSKLFFLSLFKPFFTAFHIAHISHIGQTGHLIALDFLFASAKDVLCCAHSLWLHYIPFFCKLTAIAFPMPRDAPVTSTVFLAIRKTILPNLTLLYHIWQGKPCIPF